MDKNLFANIMATARLSDLARLWKTHRQALNAAQRYIFLTRATRLRLAT